MSLQPAPPLVDDEIAMFFRVLGSSEWIPQHSTRAVLSDSTRRSSVNETHLTPDRAGRRFRRVAPPVVGRYDGGGVLPGARRGLES